MSFNVLVIPEDPTWNGYILKPLTKALLDDAGKPNARVKLLENPRVGGYDQALSAIRGELPDRYGFFDLWLFLPDADLASADAMDNLEADLQSRDISLLCCPAQPEIEIYACAAFRDDLPGTWEEARTHPTGKLTPGFIHSRVQPCRVENSDEGGSLRAASAEARRSETGGRRQRNDDQEVAPESAAAVSVVPGDRASP